MLFERFPNNLPTISLNSYFPCIYFTMPYYFQYPDTFKRLKKKSSARLCIQTYKKQASNSLTSINSCCFYQTEQMIFLRQNLLLLQEKYNIKAVFLKNYKRNSCYQQMGKLKCRIMKQISYVLTRTKGSISITFQIILFLRFGNC